MNENEVRAIVALVRAIIADGVGSVAAVKAVGEAMDVLNQHIGRTAHWITPDVADEVRDLLQDASEWYVGQEGALVDALTEAFDASNRPAFRGELKS